MLLRALLATVVAGAILGLGYLFVEHDRATTAGTPAATATGVKPGVVRPLPPPTGATNAREVEAIENLKLRP